MRDVFGVGCKVWLVDFKFVAMNCVGKGFDVMVIFLEIGIMGVVFVIVTVVLVGIVIFIFLGLIIG